MPYEPSIDAHSGSGDLNTVYSQNIVDVNQTREIDSEITNSNGEVIGYNMRNKFPDANADYSSKQLGARRLENQLGYNPYYHPHKKEIEAPKPYKEEDEMSVQRKLASRNAMNSKISRANAHKDGIVAFEQTMDTGPPEYMRGGHDRRATKDKLYKPLDPNRGKESERKVDPSTRINPVSYTPKNGNIRVEKRYDYANVEPSRYPSAKEAIEKNKFGYIRVSDTESKRAQNAPSTRTNGSDVVNEQARVDEFESELVNTRQYDVTYLPSIRNQDENPVSGTFNVRDTTHERVDNLPAEYDFAQVSKRNAPESQTPGHIQYNVGDTRPLPNRTDYEDKPTNFIKRSELEKANPTGFNDKVSNKKTPIGARSVKFDKVVYDQMPGSKQELGEDDALHTVRDGLANMDGLSRKHRNRFAFDQKQSIGGRNMFVPPASIGKQETWRKNVYDRDISLSRPTGTHTKQVVGPQDE